MNRRFVVAPLCAAVAGALLLTTPVRAQDAGEITEALLEIFLQAYAAEDVELQKVRAELDELDEKIAAFESCKEAFELAGEATGSRLGGFAAKAAMKAKCGATSSDGYHKDRKKLTEKPLQAALDVFARAGMKKAPYGAIKERVFSWTRGVRAGFSATELAALDARGGQIASGLGVTLMAALPAGGDEAAGGARGRRSGRGVGGGVWTADYAWEHIGFMLSTMYISGATLFEKPYEPGQWTRWRYTESDVTDEHTEVERAFLGRTAEGGEWWRTTWIEVYPDGEGGEAADTVVMEALYTGVDEYVKQLVRMRGRMPGQAEAQEMMVPQHMAMLSSLAAFPFRPTEESLQGATVGRGPTATPAGSFNARHVRFGGSGGGTIEWWLSEEVPGGWLRFQATEQGGDEEAYRWTMEITGQGTGARSELGIEI